jgi:TRAP-type uncharacterized transport system fused permease subunit
MFVFYFSVLSEATPPTALAAVAASAVTGGQPIRTMWETLRYSLPAFLVPLAFVVTEPGQALLGQGEVLQIVWAAAAACLGVAALAIATGGWVLGIGTAGTAARVLAAAAGLLLLYLHPVSISIGAGLLACAAVVSIIDRNEPREAGESESQLEQGRGAVGAQREMT